MPALLRFKGVLQLRLSLFYLPKYGSLKKSNLQNLKKWQTCILFVCFQTVAKVLLTETC